MGSEFSEWMDGVDDVVLRDSEQNMKVSVESRRKAELAVGRPFACVRRRVLYVGLSIYGTRGRKILKGQRFNNTFKSLNDFGNILQSCFLQYDTCT